jgi:hypothetical protein
MRLTNRIARLFTKEIVVPNSLRMTGFLLGLAAATMSIPATAADGFPSGGSDRVFFTNGDQLSGDFVGATGSTVNFNAKVAGNVAIRWTEISRILLASAGVSIVRKDASRGGLCTSTAVAAPTIEVNNGRLEWKGTKGNLSTAIDEIVSVSAPSAMHETRTSSCSAGWTGQISMQNSAITATQNQYQLGGTLHVARDTGHSEAFKHQVTDMTAQASFGESSKPGVSPIRTVLYEGLVQHDVYLTLSKDGFSGTYLFGLSDFYHNLSLAMNFQQSYGAGLGWEHVNAKGHVYGVAGDLRFVGEDLYSPGVSETLAASGLSEHYSLPVFLNKRTFITLFERISFIPAFSDSRAFQARGVAGADLPLGKRLSIGLQETDDYLRNAPPKSKQNYSKASMNLKYTLGPLPSK